ncbi:hypothetical protein B1B05_17235 [Domibacillus enclensis]|uniref:YolD-like protein n=1 Tax=Domibacillus enclensis TaxID=1017273 RepID=A0A1N7C2X5_9BACI|nr:hypothetical protein B1B05_17235 [Domibacillus enclensis]SIR57939.1 hypothetical protein SAMN05443094_11143 [Domibacillus enclensis]
MKEVNVVRKQYEDRGMLKWRGLILSEHAEMMKNEKSRIVRRDIYFDDQQYEEMNRIATISIHLKKEVVFELNTFGDEDLLKVSGVVCECGSLPGQKPYIKLSGFSSRFWAEEIVSMQLAEGDGYEDAD